MTDLFAALEIAEAAAEVADLTARVDSLERLANPPRVPDSPPRAPSGLTLRAKPLTGRFNGSLIRGPNGHVDHPCAIEGCNRWGSWGVGNLDVEKATWFCRQHVPPTDLPRHLRKQEEG